MNYPVKVPAGARYTLKERPDVALLFRLEPGRYRARVIYEEEGIDGNHIKCTSNRVHFRVELLGDRGRVHDVEHPQAPR